MTNAPNIDKYLLAKIFIDVGKMDTCLTKINLHVNNIIIYGRRRLVVSLPALRANIMGSIPQSKNKAVNIVVRL